jgi:hypothetical protein
LCCGPAILVLLVVVWAFSLTCGMALPIQPKLGTSIGATRSETPTDFTAAM